MVPFFAHDRRQTTTPLSIEVEADTGVSCSRRRGSFSHFCKSECTGIGTIFDWNNRDHSVPCKSNWIAACLEGSGHASADFSEILSLNKITRLGKQLAAVRREIVQMQSLSSSAILLAHGMNSFDSGVVADL